MKTLLYLNLKSLTLRKFSTALTIMSLSISCCLFFLLNDINQSAKNSFINGISKTDLIVGEKTGPINLLLYTIFHMGDAVNNIKYESYLEVSKNPQVAWTIPISLGDSFKNYRVVATNNDFFKHYQFNGEEHLSFFKGKEFSQTAEVVLGNKVAKNLNLELGQEINITHGIQGGLESQVHDHIKFKIVGILNATAGPVDNALYINLQSMEAIHDEEYTQGKEYLTEQITSFLLGAKSRMFTLFLQRNINSMNDANLMAIIPGVTINNLWSLVGQAENAILFITYAVIIVSFFTLIIGIYNQLNDRRKEMAILRSQGLSAYGIFSLLITESIFISFMSFVFGLILKQLVLTLGKTYAFEYLSINLKSFTDFNYTFQVFIVYICIAFIMGLIPAYSAYRNTIKDGLNTNI